MGTTEARERCYAYLAHRSKNSIIGNILRGTYSGMGSQALAKLSRNKLSEKEARHLAETNGSKFTTASRDGIARYYFNENLVEVSPSLRSKYLVAHEVGHHNSMKENNSFNTKTRNQANSSMGIVDPDANMRSEREAWVKAVKLVGKPKSLIDKYQMKLALNSYEKGLESEAQTNRFHYDKDYAKKMLKRTGVKLGGTVVGGVIGNRLSHKLLTKTQTNYDLLRKKPNKTEADIKELTRLSRKISNYKKLSTVAGAVGGYALSKKYLTKHID